MQSKEYKTAFDASNHDSSKTRHRCQAPIYDRLILKKPGDALMLAAVGNMKKEHSTANM